MKDDLGDRMKGYEHAWDLRLPRRIPVLLRLDGNNFSRFTKQAGFGKPFDDRMTDAMVAATTAVLEYCSGSMLGYTQSDEITILLRNDRSNDDQPHLGNRVQKLASLCASVCTDAFGRALRAQGVDAGPVAFDCRVFLVPKADVLNCFVWRQEDAFRNCVSATAYWALHGEVGPRQATEHLMGLGNSGKQELLFHQFGTNVNDLPVRWRRGVCVRRVATQRPLRDTLAPDKFAELVSAGHVDPDQVVTRQAWTRDDDIPRFTQSPEYITGLL